LEWVKSLFSKTERKLIYSTSMEADHMRIMNNLDAVGVPYVPKKIPIARNLSFEGQGGLIEYQFYVKIEDERRAYMAINQDS
jgi:hypothetical protein